MRKSGIIVLAISLLALVSVATVTAMTPKQLHSKLLTTQYKPLPQGYYSAKVGSSTLDNRMNRHHAVGAVQVTLSGDGAIYYVVFRSLRFASVATPSVGLSVLPVTRNRPAPRRQRQIPRRLESRRMRRSRTRSL